MSATPLTISIGRAIEITGVANAAIPEAFEYNGASYVYSRTIDGVPYFRRVTIPFLSSGEGR